MSYVCSVSREPMQYIMFHKEHSSITLKYSIVKSFKCSPAELIQYQAVVSMGPLKENANLGTVSRVPLIQCLFTVTLIIA